MLHVSISIQYHNFFYNGLLYILSSMQPLAQAVKAEEINKGSINLRVTAELPFFLEKTPLTFAIYY